MISYDKLWKLLIDNKMNKTQFRKVTNIGTNTLAKLGKNKPVSMDIILKICDHFQCNISDIMDVYPETTDNGGNENDNSGYKK